MSHPLRNMPMVDRLKAMRDKALKNAEAAGFRLEAAPAMAMLSGALGPMLLKELVVAVGIVACQRETLAFIRPLLQKVAEGKDDELAVLARDALQKLDKHLLDFDDEPDEQEGSDEQEGK